MKLTNVITLSAVATVATLSLSTAAFATTNTESNNTDHKVTICHATNSATNPYVKITVDTHAAVKAGHAGHDEGVVATSVAKATELKEAKITWGDVIPAIPEQNFAGLNWTADGKALFNHDCAMTNVTTTSTKTETPANTKPEDQKTETKADTKTSVGAAGTPAELPQTGTVSPVAGILGLGSLVSAGSYYLASRRARL